jgi:hypothetical protein
MPRALPRHCYCERNRRSGTPMYYVRVGKGPRVRIKAAFGTSEFEAEYQAAISGKTPARKTEPTAGSGLADRPIPRGECLDIALDGDTSAARKHLQAGHRFCWRQALHVDHS